jgi:hypothetical protein
VTDAHSIGELGNRLYALWFPREDGTCAKLEVLSGLGGLDPGARDRTVLTITGDCTR